jgi:hypothetical protein
VTQETEDDYGRAWAAMSGIEKFRVADDSHRKS